MLLSESRGVKYSSRRLGEDGAVTWDWLHVDGHFAAHVKALSGKESPYKFAKFRRPPKVVLPSKPAGFFVSQWNLPSPAALACIDLASCFYNMAKLELPVRMAEVRLQHAMPECL